MASTWQDMANPGLTGNQAASNNINSGTNPFWGFAKEAGYNPQALSQTIFQNPWAILPDVFKGINKEGAGYSMMRDIGADPLTLYEIMQGSHGNSLTGRAGGTAAGDYTNWLANLMQSISTPQSQGGAGRDFSGYELLRNIFTADTKSSLGQLMTAGNQSAQARSLQNILNAASSVGMNPLAQRGYQSAVQRATDEALNLGLKETPNQGTNNQALYQTIAQLHPELIPGR